MEKEHRSSQMEICILANFTKENLMVMVNTIGQTEVITKEISKKEKEMVMVFGKEQ